MPNHENGEHGEHEYDCHDKKGCQIVINCGGSHYHPPRPPEPPIDYCDCPEEYVEVYSVIPQELAASPGLNMPGDPVLLEVTQIASAGFDVSQAATLGEIKVLKKGVYRINKAVSGSLNPIGAPLKLWSMSIFINGVLLPASTFADMTLSPEQHCNQTVSIVIVQLNVGDIITLNNTTDAPLFLGTTASGSNAVPLVADINMSLLKAN